jgi:hypothetical protein
LAFAEDENQFIYNGFKQAKLHLDGIAVVHSNGLLQLTNISNQQPDRAFYQFPIKFNTTLSTLTSSLSFSINFLFAIVPQEQNLGGHGIAFTISPTRLKVVFLIKVFSRSSRHLFQQFSLFL